MQVLAEFWNHYFNIQHKYPERKNYLQVFKKSPGSHNPNVHHSQYLGELLAQADPDPIQSISYHIITTNFPKINLQILTAYFNVIDLTTLMIAA